MQEGATITLTPVGDDPATGETVSQHVATYNPSGEGGDGALLTGRYIERDGCVVIEDKSERVVLPVFPLDEVAWNSGLVYQGRTYAEGDNFELDGGQASPDFVSEATVPANCGTIDEVWVVDQQGVGNPVGDPAIWTIPVGERPLPTSTEFTAAVSRLGCNSGETGEVFEPRIEYNATDITVTFEVAAVDGARCPSNKPVEVKVRLSELVGDRDLRRRTVSSRCRRRDHVVLLGFSGSALANRTTPDERRPGAATQSLTHASRDARSQGALLARRWPTVRLSEGSLLPG